jgi:methionyl-tRNA formyltransferase
MEQGLDTGDIISHRRVAIEPAWNAGDLHDVLAPLGAELLMESLVNIEAAIRQARTQDASRVTYAPRLTKQQAEIDWNKPVAELSREIRAFNPWPVSYTFLHDDNLRLWSARVSTDVERKAPGMVVEHNSQGLFVSCADGVLQVTELQFAGRKKCSAAQAQIARNLRGYLLGKK